MKEYPQDKLMGSLRSNSKFAPWIFGEQITQLFSICSQCIYWVNGGLPPVGLDAAYGPSAGRYNRRRAGLDRRTFPNSRLHYRRVRSWYPFLSIRSLFSTRGTLLHNAGPALRMRRHLPVRPKCTISGRTKKESQENSYPNKTQNTNSRLECHP